MRRDDRADGQIGYSRIYGGAAYDNGTYACQFRGYEAGRNMIELCEVKRVKQSAFRPLLSDLPLPIYRTASVRASIFSY